MEKMLPAPKVVIATADDMPELVNHLLLPCAYDSVLGSLKRFQKIRESSFLQPFTRDPLGLGVTSSY